MKVFLICLGVIAVCHSAQLPEVKVTWGVTLDPHAGEDCFRPIPMTKEDAIAKGWQVMPSPIDHLPSLELLGNLQDPTVSVFYDEDTGRVAGINIAIISNSMNNAGLDWATQGWIDWYPPVKTGEPIAYRTKQQYFYSKEYLEMPVEYRMDNYDSSKFFQDDGIWLSGIDAVLDYIPITQKEIEKGPFTKQSCIPTMGRHYFNITKTSQCTSESFYPWFLLGHSGNLVGTGVICFAEVPESQHGVKWVERPSKLAVETIVKDRPQCLSDMAKKHTTTTMHIFYISEPWGMGCISN